MSATQERATRSSQARLPWSSVALTPLEESDVDLIHAWQNDPGLRDLTMGFRLPLQKATVREWLQAMQSPSQQHTRVVYAVRHNDQAVGIMQLYGIVPFQRRAEIGVFLSSSESRAAGVGYIAAALLLDFAFNGLDLRKVGAEILSSNTGTVRLCERMGFVLEGLKRKDYFADGVCWDTSVFGLLREEFVLSLPSEARRLCRTMDKSRS